MRFTTFSSSVLLYAILGATYPTAVEAVELSQHDSALLDAGLFELAQTEAEGEGEAEKAGRIRTKKRYALGSLAQTEAETEVKPSGNRKPQEQGSLRGEGGIPRKGTKSRLAQVEAEAEPSKRGSKHFNGEG